MSGRKTEKDRPGFAAMLKAAHQRKFDIVVFWALDRLTREGTRATLNYLQRLESKGVGYVSYQEQWLDSTGPFKDVMISMFATLAKQERARISERTIAGLKVARVKGKRLGRPPLPEETVRTVLSLNQDAGIGARKIAKSTGFPLGTVSAILSRSRQQSIAWNSKTVLCDWDTNGRMAKEMTDSEEELSVTKQGPPAVC